MDDIHTHSDYNDNTCYVKNIQLTSDTLTDELISELNSAAEKPNKFLSVGIHPWNINDLSQTTLTNIVDVLLPKIAAYNKVFAIGECGIDKCIKTDFNKQKEVFVKQIELSESIGKPVIIHAVRAYNEIANIKKQLHAKQQWIIHGFNSNVQIAISLISLNCKLSINKFHVNNPKIITLLNSIPKEHILFETDTLQKCDVELS